MALRPVQVNLKARDDAALGRFWAAALDWQASTGGHGATSVAPAGFVWTDPGAPLIVDVIKVPDPGTVRYRTHIDLATTSLEHQAALVERLTRLGATLADVGQGDVPWSVLADPEGNVFCVREPRDAHHGTGPIAAVVVDCDDPPVLARFWAEALAWIVHEMTGDVARLRSSTGTGPYLEFRRTSQVTVWHRSHLDVVPFRGGGQEAEVERLRRLGATLADVGQGGFSWRVLADPGGNEFCVLAPG